jgi:hypothetical protein
VRKRGKNKREDILFCLSYRGTSNLALNKERVMGAVKRAIIFVVTPNVPQDLTLFGRGPPKFGRRESETGAKGQERGQAKGKVKESPPKEIRESVVIPKRVRQKLLARIGRGVMAFASMAPIVDTPMMALKQEIKERMRLFSSLPRRVRRRENNYHH